MGINLNTPTRMRTHLQADKQSIHQRDILPPNSPDENGRANECIDQIGGPTGVMRLQVCPRDTENKPASTNNNCSNSKITKANKQRDAVKV
ncbi:hypothetical protein EG68_08564 [Paragonimus skrjabini miyazakii]|uniref:Uncharacterized protein n=1 Tax=Paragonimus skrjabini miyazakii TaxID=59628 RepID=A0A8S9YEZ5_9TREM|nr:hypothetical protein EG68_08564 [Paragonimus skrjabini miyazakii]